MAPELDPTPVRTGPCGRLGATADGATIDPDVTIASRTAPRRPG
jgi:hypothetical protein